MRFEGLSPIPGLSYESFISGNESKGERSCCKSQKVSIAAHVGMIVVWMLIAKPPHATCQPRFIRNANWHENLGLWKISLRKRKLLLHVVLFVDLSSWESDREKGRSSRDCCQAVGSHGELPPVGSNWLENLIEAILILSDLGTACCEQYVLNTFRRAGKEMASRALIGSKEVTGVHFKASTPYNPRQTPTPTRRSEAIASGQMNL